ncbi:Trimeric intracellular cation channel type B [Microtus ochrogaster]|uniref:Trimeric intracellular cation channel type B n=1 Tax=Microtus ochrogaster TaxID=79684 RepID=A0A8J6KX67_MICOH|nr:Trimeric intracellular cation channel type B [Microtus ochrogaster]
MDYLWDDLTLSFSRTSMFPFFDIAHYLVSVMALKQRPGAGGAVVTSCEQLLKGDWKPTGIEWLKMSFPSKVTLLGSVLFTLQHTQHLAMSKHDLMFLYTIFLLTVKVRMMMTKSIPMTFSPFEDILSRMLFGWQQQFLWGEKKPDVKPSSNGTASSVSKPTTEELDAAKRHAKKED